MNQGLKFLSALSSKSMLLAMLNSLCLITFSSCGFKATSKGANLFERSQYIISGVVTPLLGSIAAKPSSNFLVNSSYAALCASPVYAQLYKLKNDGTTDDSQILLSEQVGPDAKYSFDLTAANLVPATSRTVEYVVKVNGCNNEVYKRPVTEFDNNQDIDAKTVDRKD